MAKPTNIQIDIGELTCRLADCENVVKLAAEAILTGDQEQVHAAVGGLRLAGRELGTLKEDIDRAELASASNALASSVSQELAQIDADKPVSHFATIAEGLGVPVWMLFIPELPERFLQSPQKERFETLVNDYLCCEPDDLQHIEAVVTAMAS